MSSKGHDFILEMIHYKIRTLGFKIVASESKYKHEGFKIPPTIINHRPDALGIKDNKIICIGEAKYYRDLSSKRSHRQIKDFIKLTTKKDLDVNVVFGVPTSESQHFLSILEENNLSLGKKVFLLKVPDRLISKENER